MMGNRSKPWLIAGCTVGVIGCGEAMEEPHPPTGTMLFRTDPVVASFVSEDGWTIELDGVYASVSTPAAYHALKLPDDSTPSQLPAAARSLTPQHATGGIAPPTGLQETSRQSLTGAFFVDLQDAPAPLGRLFNVPSGPYNRSDWSIKPMKPHAAGYVDRYDGASLVLVGTAVSGVTTVLFELVFTRSVEFRRCGSNGTDGDDGPAAVGGELVPDGELSVTLGIRPEYLFGDINEGPAETDDTTKINHIAVGFQPFADLAEPDPQDSSRFVLVNLTSTDMIRRMPATTYQFVDMALDHLGYSGPAKCYVFKS